jgi:hypothetical protein
MIDNKNMEIILSNLKQVHYSSFSPYTKEKINTAIVIIEAGFVENLLNSTIIKNLVNLLAPFIRNAKVKQAIKLLQEGLEDQSKLEKENFRGRPMKKLKSNIEIEKAIKEEFKDEEVYTNGKVQIKFIHSSLECKVIDINGYYINFKDEDSGRCYLNKLLDRYDSDKIKFKKVKQ